MPTIEIRVDLTGIPHSFIIINNGAGFEQGYGFAPATANDPAGSGHVYSDTTHEYDFSSGSINITNEQYNAIVAKINADIANPPYYNAPGSILFPGSVQQCAQWVTDLAQQGNVSLPFTMHRGGWNPYGQAVWLGIDSGLSAIGQSISDAFNAAAGWVAPRRDPLVFDLNGNGIETVPINSAAPILFDHTGSGMKVATGWIAPSDGFLALDRNGNGTVDNGTELFGDSTPLASGGNAADGFAALAAQDSNADGAVNALDANFANLRVWQDANQDGISFVDANGNGVLDAGETSELKTLAELGIASIKVAKIENSQMLANGNEIADLGSFTRTDGSVGGMGVTSGLADVNLASDTFHRMFLDAVPLDPLAAALPDMQGSGLVRDLREAANDAGWRFAA